MRCWGSGLDCWQRSTGAQYDSRKFSSSRSVVIYVRDVLERYGADPLRYYLAAAGPETSDTDYQPAIEAGMAMQAREMLAIAQDPEPPTFENTLIPMERSGRLLQRALAAFSAVTGANTNPFLQKIKSEQAPKLAAHYDSIYLNADLFARVATVYKQRESLQLDLESSRLLQITYDDIVHAGALLSETEKEKLKKINEELSTLSNTFSNKILSATKDGAYFTTDKAALAGLSDARIAAAAQAAEQRNQTGYLLPLQNTTQQPELALLSDRTTRQDIFDNSWNRAENRAENRAQNRDEKGDANDTRDTVAQIAHLRALRADLLGYASHAAWKLQDQMAKTPETALKFMDAMVPIAIAKSSAEAADIQSVIDSQGILAS